MVRGKNKLTREYDAYTDFLPPTATKAQRRYHYRNQLTFIPKCEFTGEDCAFTYKGYSKVSKLYQNLICHDSNIKVSMLKFYNLLKIGAPFEQLAQLKKEKYFHKVREDFRLCDSIEDIKNRFIEMGFKDHVIPNLIGNLDQNNWSTIKSFIERYYYTTDNVKNLHFAWYTIRGYTSEEAEARLYEQHNAWDRIKEELHNDPEKYEKWVATRMNGLLAQGGRPSKFEAQLKEEFKKNHNVETQSIVHFSKIDSKYHDKIKNKCRYMLDMIIDDIIVEYNGSFWHHDYIKMLKHFTYEDYLPEIIKFKHLNQITGRRVFVLWERDIKNIFDAVELIESFLKTNEIFGSSRNIDIEIFKAID
jgi:hypothetical protein